MYCSTSVIENEKTRTSSITDVVGTARAGTGSIADGVINYRTGTDCTAGVIGNESTGSDCIGAMMKLLLGTELISTETPDMCLYINKEIRYLFFSLAFSNVY